MEEKVNIVDCGVFNEHQTIPKFSDHTWTDCLSDSLTQNENSDIIYSPSNFYTFCVLLKTKEGICNQAGSRLP